MKNWQKLLLFTVLASVCVSAQTRITSQSVTQYKTQTSPGNPSANSAYFYFDGTNLVCVTSTGATCLSSGSGTVSNIATTAPLGGGPITTTGTLTCTTCTTNSAALTSTAIVTGAGGQAAQTPSATSTLDASGNAVFAGSVTGTSFIGTAAGGAGNSWLCAEGTDPGTEAANKDLLWCSSSSHRLMLSNNNGTSSAVVSAGAVNTALSTMTLDMSAAAATTGLRLPNAAGAVPTVDGNIAEDTTTHTLRCGNGTTTTRCMVEALIAGGQGTTGNASTTQFGRLIAGFNAAGSSEAGARLMLPFAGTLTSLCVTTLTTQSANNNLVFSIKDSTAAGSAGSLSVTFAAGATAQTICDTTNSDTVIAQHDYSLQITNNANVSSAQIGGVSVVYTY